MTEHTNIALALAKAQAKMGPALKDSTNPAFKSKYADLSSVMAACMPALNENNIAVIQPTVDEDGQRYVMTILLHGPSGDRLECRVPLIVSKNDMQGYGSAVTYARRYGLMCMAGIAPDDDDGNAAAKAPPHDEPRRQELPKSNHIGAHQFLAMKDKMDDAGVTDEQISKAYGVEHLEQMPIDIFQRVMKKLDATIAARNPVDQDIPF